MEDVGILYVHLVCFTAIWYIWWPVGIFNGYVVYFPRFGVFLPRKIWQPCSTSFFSGSHPSLWERRPAPRGVDFMNLQFIRNLRGKNVLQSFILTLRPN
jgi:hypothetical protein